jgi:predicted permease
MWARDIRLAVRNLRKAPVFTVVAVVTLTLAIGANTAMFSLLNALLLRDLPVRDPQSLVELSALAPGSSYEGGLSYPMYRDLQGRHDLFASVIGWRPISVVAVDTGHGASRSATMYASANFFAELGARPAAGRFPTAGEVAESTWKPAAVAVIGHTFWRQRFGAAPTAIGETIRVEGHPFTIVGVAPEGFRGLIFEMEPDVILPLTSIPAVEDSDAAVMMTSSMFVRVTGRLRPGVTLARARAALDAWWPAIKQTTTPSRFTAPQRERFLATRLSTASAAKGVEPGRGWYTRPLLVVFSIAALVLAIACANLASLMVARGATRAREIAVRLALGATRWRIVRQVLVEGLVLSLAGAAGGVAVAYWSSRAFVATMFQDYTVPAGLDVTPDARLVGFAAMLAALVALLFSAVPAWLVTRRESTTVLQQDARTMSTSRGAGRLLIAVQIALSLALLTDAGLLVRSLAEIRGVDPGMKSERVYLAYPMPRPRGYLGLDNDAYYPALTERLAQIPGVERLTFALSKLAAGTGGGGDGQPVSRIEPGSPQIRSTEVASSPGLFDALGISLRSGRDFSWSDNSRGAPVAIVSEALARRLFGDANPVGGRIRVGLSPAKQQVEVVGVAANARLYDLKDPNLATVYVPALQEPAPSYKSIIVRGSPATIDAVRSAVSSFGHEDVTKMESLEYITDRALLRERTVAALAAFFGGLAIALAAIGLYGLMSYAVEQRRREIGIRMALGAQARRIVGSIVGDGLVVTLEGIAAGLALAFATATLVKSLLFGVELHDPLTLAAATLLLIAVTIAASLAPALRAARTDPMVVLRSE